jgi:hypothetical protein
MAGAGMALGLATHGEPARAGAPTETAALHGCTNESWLRAVSKGMISISAKQIMGNDARGETPPSTRVRNSEAMPESPDIRFSFAIRRFIQGNFCKPGCQFRPDVKFVKLWCQGAATDTRTGKRKSNTQKSILRKCP